MRSPSCGITGNGSDVDEDEVFTLNLSASQGLSSDWTDEKHSLYLNSMEASFVDQFYTSFNSTACLIHDSRHSRIKSTKLAESCSLNEFKVHQNGNPNKRRFEKVEPPRRDIQESHHLLGNQWTQPCKMDMRKHRIAWWNISAGSPILNSEARILYSNVGQEFSDQNFDDDNDEEGGGMRAPKRAKVIAKSSSSKYQVNSNLSLLPAIDSVAGRSI